METEKLNISLLGIKLIREKTVKYNWKKEFGIDTKITNPENVVQMFNSVLHLCDQPEEVFGMIALDCKGEISGMFEIARGTLTSAIVHPREVFKRALICNAQSVIVAHNHPSGEVTPSNEDINLTKRLYEAGKMIGVEVLDHIVVGDNDFFSFKQKSLIL